MMDAVGGVFSGRAPASGALLPLEAEASPEDANGHLAPVRLSTDSVATGDRVDWWRDQLEQRFGLECALEPEPAHPFRIDLALTQFGAMTLIESSSSPLRLRHRGNPGAGRVFLQLQQEGSWQVSGYNGGREIAECGPDSLLLIHVRDDTSYATCGSFRQVGVMLEEAALTELCPHWQRFAFRPIPVSRGLAVMVKTHMLSLTEQLTAMDSRSAATLASPTLTLISAWLNSLDCAPHPDVPGLPDFHRKRVKEFVSNNLCDPALSVEMIAKAVGLSVRYLHKLFEDEAAGLMRWAATKRLEHCRDKLSDPRLRNRTISDIAYGAGFNDLAHFSRSFRKRFKTSPTQARLSLMC
jgi:AraC-like DNA-binding protein